MGNETLIRFILLFTWMMDIKHFAFDKQIPFIELVLRSRSMEMGKCDGG